MRIAISSSYNGFRLKQYLQTRLIERVDWIDFGCEEVKYSEYPQFVVPVCLEVLKGQVDLGILVCATGIGMSIIANRFPYIYAAIAWNEEVAKLSKEQENSNILIIPADFLTNESAEKIVNAWISATFKTNDYQDNICMIDTISENLYQHTVSQDKCC